MAQSLTRPVSLIWILSGLLVLNAHCSAVDIAEVPTLPVVPTPPPPPPAPPVLQIVPDYVGVNPQQELQFQGTLGGKPITAEDLQWTVADTSLGAISSSGHFVATHCFLPGNTKVLATGKRDSSLAAFAVVAVVIPSAATVQIESAQTAGSDQPVDPSNAAGAIEFRVQADPLTCRDIVALRLKISGPRGDTLLNQLSWSPPSTQTVRPVLRWNSGDSTGGTRAFPDGLYTVTAMLLDSRSLLVPSNAVPLRLVNH